MRVREVLRAYGHESSLRSIASECEHAILLVAQDLRHAFNDTQVRLYCLLIADLLS